MKVVLFCGGQGMRIREFSERIPKPMVPIGYRPILWHVMKYYAHFGHKDFVLCLGYKADVIKRYFLNYEEAVSNDFVLSGGGKQVDLLTSDIHDWRVTFVDTGMHSNIGERLQAVRPFLEGEEFFLANYSDGLTDLPLNEMIDYVKSEDATASCLCVRPSVSFHAIRMGESNRIDRIEDLRDSGVLLNGGYFVLRGDIFDAMEPGDELVYAPFRRLAERQKLLGYPYRGFWTSMDTFKERQQLEDLWSEGTAPWAVWEDRSEEPGS
jgi:glucose-1-phosphate cytidylyltransferase